MENVKFDGQLYTLWLLNSGTRKAIEKISRQIVTCAKFTDLHLGMGPTFLVEQYESHALN